MANPKRHWAIPVNNPRKHQHPWIGHAGGYYVKACGRKYCSDTQSGSASAFLSHVDADPGWHCSDCAKAARLALAKEQPIAVSFSSTVRRCCTRCRSGAINPSDHGRTDGVDLDLCDVCYWRKRAPEPRPIGDAPHDGSLVLICLPDSKPQWTMGVFDRAHWIDLCCAASVVEPTHFLPLPPSPEVK